MPTYDYYCETNGQTVEVNHPMSLELSTWGELCERLGMPPGETPVDAAIHKLATGGQVVRSSSLGEKAAPCGAPQCAGGSCAFK